MKSQSERKNKPGQGRKPGPHPPRETISIRLRTDVLDKLDTICERVHKNRRGVIEQLINTTQIIEIIKE